MPHPKIYRTQVMEGVIIPGIIRNGNYFLSGLHVYGDGRVDDWDFEDFEGFKRDVRRGWVATQVPDGGALSIHHLGQWQLDNGRWQYDAEGFIDHVWSVVKELNPELSNLYEYTPRKINGIVYGESGKGRSYYGEPRFERDPMPERIAGDRSMFCYQDEAGDYYLTLVEIFAEDKIVLQWLPESITLTFDELKALVPQERVRSSPPVGSTIKLMGLGEARLAAIDYEIAIDSKLAEISDMLKKLKGEPDSAELCVQRYEEYCEQPSVEARDKLREAYEAVPEHERMYLLGDQDRKDFPIRIIIYGEDEIEGWSHRAAARADGLPLPTIQVPKIPGEE